MDFIIGPPCLPLIGSIPFIQMVNFQLYMEKARDKYGPVIGMKLGTKNTIVFCGPKEVQEAFKIDDLQGRPPMLIVSKSATKGRSRYGYNKTRPFSAPPVY